LPLTRADFKQELVQPHLFMNLCVVDEHGRMLGMSRNLAGLKAEFGSLARSSFQALAALKLATPAAAPKGPGASGPKGETAPTKAAGPALDAAQGHTSWDFGELPELMEIRKGGQTLIGFPALIDQQTQVVIEVFDEPEQARLAHEKGLARLFALQLKEPLRGLEKNLGPDLQRLGVAYLPLGTLEELRAQVLQLALQRAFLSAPWPTDAKTFDQRLAEGRPRLVLIAQEVLRQAGVVLTEHQAAARKLKDARVPKPLQDDLQAQLDRLLPKQFLVQTGWLQLQHLPRYLKGIQLRLDKWRQDAARDERLLAELRPLEQRWQRRVAELRGARDPRLEDFRWQLEELRVGLFAQELRTPQPVSVKRLEKVWLSLSN
jgi:ATP-dependent helicase HrpA